MSMGTMTKKTTRHTEGTWDYALLLLALLKRGELVPVYEEARKQAWRKARTAFRRKIN
jgi:hypothetical protein